MAEKVLGFGGKAGLDKITIVFEMDDKPVKTAEEAIVRSINFMNTQIKLAQVDMREAATAVNQLQTGVNLVKDVQLIGLIADTKTAENRVTALENSLRTKFPQWQSMLGMVKRVMEAQVKGLDAFQTRLNAFYQNASRQKKAIEDELLIVRAQVKTTITTARQTLGQISQMASLAISGIQTIFQVFGVQLTPLQASIMSAIQAILTTAASAAAMYEASGNPVLIAIGIALQVAAASIAITGAAQATTQIELARIQSIMSIIQLRDAEAQIRAMLSLVGVF